MAFKNQMLLCPVPCLPNLHKCQIFHRLPVHLFESGDEHKNVTSSIENGHSDNAESKLHRTHITHIVDGFYLKKKIHYRGKSVVRAVFLAVLMKVDRAGVSSTAVPFHRGTSNIYGDIGKTLCCRGSWGPDNISQELKDIQH